MLFGGDPMAGVGCCAACRRTRGAVVEHDPRTGSVTSSRSWSMPASHRRRATRDAHSTDTGTGATASCSRTDADLAAIERLHGRYLLLQRGKKSHHLLTVDGEPPAFALAASHLVRTLRERSVKKTSWAGCVLERGGLVFLFAPRQAIPPRKSHRHQAKPALRAAKMCQSFGSLKTEEKTERQCGQVVRATSTSVVS